MDVMGITRDFDQAWASRFKRMLDSVDQSVHKLPVQEHIAALMIMNVLRRKAALARWQRRLRELRETEKVVTDILEHIKDQICNAFLMAFGSTDPMETWNTRIRLHIHV
jgi:hypothetical protein